MLYLALSADAIRFLFWIFLISTFFGIGSDKIPDKYDTFLNYCFWVICLLLVFVPDTEEALLLMNN